MWGSLTDNLTSMESAGWTFALFPLPADQSDAPGDSSPVSVYPPHGDVSDDECEICAEEGESHGPTLPEAQRRLCTPTEGGGPVFHVGCLVRILGTAGVPVSATEAARFAAWPVEEEQPRIWTASPLAP